MSSRVTVEKRGYGRNGMHYTAMRSGFTAHADSRAEAARKLEDGIDKALTGTYDPLVIMPFLGAAFAVIWRGAEAGWQYRIIDPHNMEERYYATAGENAPAMPLHTSASGSFNDSRGACEREARFTLAQYLYDAEIPFFDPDDDRGTMVWIADPADREQLADWERWQQAARQARDEGHPDPWRAANEARDRGYK